MTDRQKRSLAELRHAAWEVGWSFGYEGVTSLAMLMQLHGELGDPLPPWMLPQLEAGHRAGVLDAMNDERTPGPGSDDTVVRIAGDVLPF